MLLVKEEAFTLDGYDEEVANNTIIEQAKAEEEAKWEWDNMDEVVRLTALLAKHTASLSPTARATARRVGRPDGAASAAVRGTDDSAAVCATPTTLHATGDPCIGATSPCMPPPFI
jgi:hypothetical protein